MSKSLMKPLVLVGVVLTMYFMMRPKSKRFELDEELQPQLPSGSGITREHALHFYEVFLNILLNKHNKFAEHAENVYLLNYILRNDVKWRVTETALFNMLDITGNNYVNQKEYESFADLFPNVRDRQTIDGFRLLVDRNIDTKIMRSEWISFCNKNLRPKLLQDLQEWEQNHGPLPNPKNITAQFTAINKEERNHRDLIHGQLDRALTLLHNGFKTFVDHFEHNTPHGIDDQDMFVRRIGLWIINRFERWEAMFMWIYQLLDDNGDGELTPKECASQFNIFSVSVIHVRELFEYFDDDGDGIITRQEWSDYSETMRRLLSQYFNS